MHPEQPMAQTMHHEQPVAQAMHPMQPMAQAMHPEQPMDQAMHPEQPMDQAMPAGQHLLNSSQGSPRGQKRPRGCAPPLLLVIAMFAKVVELSSYLHMSSFARIVVVMPALSISKHLVRHTRLLSIDSKQSQP